MQRSIQDVLKPTEKTYIINGRKYVAIVDFIKNRLSIKLGYYIILNETLDNYTNTDGLNMEGYINKCIKDHSKKVKQFNNMSSTIDKAMKEQLKA